VIPVLWTKTRQSDDNHPIWNSRNNVTHGEKAFDPGRSMEFVKDNVLPMELPGEVVIKEA
jgi:hypothetical protein